jgi:phage recombination protein Bet
MSQVATIQQTQWTPEQLKLITDVVAKGATSDELKLFLYRCQNMGLDPLKPGMVHFIKYGNGPGTIVVGIEGFRAIAGRTGKVSGVERGVHRDNDGRVVAGWCKVYRSDWTHPAHEEVPFDEYTTGKGPWAKMPATMIKKVAEAAALRMAFPEDLGGVYERSEMDQAEQSTRVVPEQPAAGDGYQTSSYIVPYGPPNLIRKPIEDCDPAALKEYIELIETKAKKSGKPVPIWAVELIKQAEPLIAAWERSLYSEPGSEG